MLTAMATTRQESDAPARKSKDADTKDPLTVALEGDVTDARKAFLKGESTWAEYLKAENS